MSNAIRVRFVRQFDLERFVKALMAHIRELETETTAEAETASNQPAEAENA